MRRGGVLMICCVFSFGACREAPVATPAAPGPTAPEVPSFVGGGPVDFGEGQPAEVAPVPEPSTRPRRRVDINQLDALLRGVTEGVYWSETDAPGGDNLLDELSGTLGVPDYSVMTSEDLQPSLIFQKYLGDAARSVCQQLEEREQEPGAPAVLWERAGPTDTWESAPERIDANLGRLLLRFHGRSVGPDSTRLPPWRWLFQSAYHVSSDTAVAWRTVCVGLITHPDFYLQ